MPSAIDPLEAAPAGTASTGGGMSSLMAKLDAEFATSTGTAPAPAAPDPAKPVDPAKPADPAPVVAPKVDKPANDPLVPVVPAPAKPEPEEMSVEDMEKFLKAHPNKKPWKIYESLKTTTAGKVSDLEAKLKALESKPVESPGDAAKVAALEKQIESLTGETKTYKERLAQADFRHTDAYTNFTNRANRIYQQGAAAIVAYQVTQPDGTTRAATVQDLDRLRRMDPSDREDKLDEMFGPKARLVARYTDALDGVRAEADAAEEEYAQNHEKTAVQRDMESKGHQAKFDTSYKTGLDQLGKQPGYGKWFANDEADPEGTKLFRDGLAEIEKLVSEADRMSPEEAAYHAAVTRGKAAAMPRVLRAYNELSTKAAALEAELAKFRSTDPGAKGATGGGGAVADNKPKGIDGVALAFDSDPTLIRR